MMGVERAVLRAEVVRDGRTTLLEAQLAPGQRDLVQRNRQRVTRVRELLETFQVTIFSPDDLVLVKGGPAERRDYLDDVLVSAFPKHATLRQGVDRVLRQRATLLRQAGGRLTGEIAATLDVWDAQLAELGTELTEERRNLVDELEPEADGAFRRVTGLTGPLSLRYQPSYTGALADALVAARGEDVRRGVTSVGPHRDELVLEVGTLDARTRLSQGRQRGVTLALRLAAHAVVGRHAGSDPILLLDDAFSELDAATSASLVRELPAGQAILTTAGALPADLAPRRVLRLNGGRLQ